MPQVLRKRKKSAGTDDAFWPGVPYQAMLALHRKFQSAERDFVHKLRKTNKNCPPGILGCNSFVRNENDVFYPMVIVA